MLLILVQEKTSFYFILLNYVTAPCLLWLHAMLSVL